MSDLYSEDRSSAAQSASESAWADLEQVANDELAALARFRDLCRRPTADVLDFIAQLTDGELEGEDGVPPDVRVGAGYALGMICAIARIAGIPTEEFVGRLLRDPTPPVGEFAP
jgi:hypothetical protein